MASRKFDPLTDLVDLKGKVVIVTGGNAGIGYATVRHLARAGAKVYLAARNEERASNAIAKLREDGFMLGNGDVMWLKLDLSDPRDAKKAAEEFLSKEQRLDILGEFAVNNAALLRAPYEKTKDGVTTMVTVNYISPFVFTRTLLPRLEDTAREPNSDVRIVNLTSAAYKLVPSTTSFNSVEDFNVAFSSSLLPGFTRYAHSKLMNLLWTKELQRRISAAESPAPITVIALHPGGVDTFSQNWPCPRLSSWLVRLAIADPERGAYTSVFAAASKRIAENKEEYNGVYVESKPTGRITKVGKLAASEELAAQLWGTTEAFLGSIMIKL